MLNLGVPVLSTGSPSTHMHPTLECDMSFLSVVGLHVKIEMETIRSRIGLEKTLILVGLTKYKSNFQKQI